MIFYTRFFFVIIYFFLTFELYFLSNISNSYFVTEKLLVNFNSMHDKNKDILLKDNKDIFLSWLW